MKKYVSYVAVVKIFTYTRCFFGKNRKISIEDGCCVYLCGRHHNQSNEGVHFNHNLDWELKRIYEYKWIEHYGKTEEDFRKRYGKSYL